MDRTYELIKKAQEGDSDAKDIIIKENIGLIWSVAKKFANRGYDLDDLFQIGSIGLIKCIEKFDTSFGVKFSTYAVPMIMGEIKRFLRDDGIVKISRPLKELALKAKYIQEEYQHKNGKSPTMKEIADALGVCVEELAMAIETGHEIESIYAVVHQGDGSPLYLLDKIDMNNQDENIVDIIALKESITKLSKKERQVIVMRYFQDKTQSQIAKDLGVSQVQVSRIEKRVLKNLKKYLG